MLTGKPHFQLEEMDLYRVTKYFIFQFKNGMVSQIFYLFFTNTLLHYFSFTGFICIIIDKEEVMSKQTTQLRTTLSNLKRYTNYSISVAAFTSAGDGVKSAFTYCHTQEDGKLN